MAQLPLTPPFFYAEESTLLCFENIARLMQVKILTRSKRQEREAEESVTAVETQRRIDALQQQFMEWGNGKKIELALVSYSFFCQY